MLPDIILPIIVMLLCIGTGYFVANAICQWQWKEKIPQSKLIAFTAIFVAVVLGISCLMIIAANTLFAR
jgi:hypothetical protein